MKSNFARMKKLLALCFYGKSKTIIILIVLVIIHTSIVSILPFLFGYIIDALANSKWESMKYLLIIHLLLSLFSIILNTIRNTIQSLFIASTRNALKSKIFSSIISMPKKSQDSYSYGELINRLENDADIIVSFFVETLTNVLTTLFSLVYSIVFIFSISKSLSAFAVGYAPLMLTIALVSNRILRTIFQAEKKYDDSYFGFLSEAFAGLSTIKTFVLENKFVKKVAAWYEINISIIKKKVVTENSFSLLQGSMNSIFDFLLILAAMNLIKSGNLTIGLFVSFNQYLEMFFSSLFQTLGYVSNFNYVMVSIDRVVALMNEADEFLNRCTFNKKIINIESQIENSIKIEELSFGYNKICILKGLSLSINSPGLYTIVGENGAGKSTILSLLNGLYSFTQGLIEVNNINLKEWDLYTLRNEVLFLQKDTFFLNESILDNFFLFDEHFDLDGIKDACKQVEVHDLIISLAEEYNSLMGNKGDNFSSGEKQRLNFARILNKDYSILLLDEITSDIDGKSEKKVVDIIQKIAKEKIVLSVSHKIEFIKQSKMIFVLKDGVIIDAGTHPELVKRNKSYHALFQ
ncbi:MAG: ABC transporter ATP-binding protein [Acholeplasma sp.]|nr:ABC transporter ATP-binding protein [Acholeplasma sp.]